LLSPSAIYELNVVLSQIELKEKENIRLKEQMAEQYEDWVLERSDLLVATREAESRCIEKNQTITSLQRTMAKLQGHLSGASYKPRLQNAKMYKLVEDEVDSQLEDRIEELNEAIDRLTAENLELRNEKLFLSDHTGKSLQTVAEREVESSAMQKRLLEAEENKKQAESKVAALTLLVEEFNCSEKSWHLEEQSLKAEVERLQTSLETLKLEFQSCQNERDSCLERLAELDENKEFLGSSANWSPMKGSKNAHAELRKANTALASSEEKVKLLTEMVSTMGEEWAAERQNLISEKEDLRMELSRWEQNSDVRRSSDQPLRNLSENRSVPAPDASSNTKTGDKLRQDLEKIRTENVKLRSRTREQDQAYLSVRMELSAAHAKHKDLEIEMDRVVTDFRMQLEATSLEVDKQHAHIQSCESELQRLTMMLVEAEEQMDTAEQTWRKEKAQLEAEREEARVEANEKRKEASDMLVKFEEWKITLREADSMVNALVRVNEKAKERWIREKERLASTQTEETNKVVQEMLEAVALTKEQVDMTMGHAESEMRALVGETQIMRLDMTHEILKLKREISGNNHENSGSLELLASAKCMDSERRSWEHQIKAASAVLAQKEAAIRALQVEVEKSRKQTVGVQTLHTGTQALLQEKEKMILKLVNELNHLNQSLNRDRTLRQSLRQSLTRDVDNITSLRSSFSCNTVEERDGTLSVLKEEQEQLKTMVFNLEVENAELQEQLLEAEMKTKALESTIEHFRKSDDRWIEEVRSLEEQLEESARHVSELENHRMELRDEMQRQAASFAELYEQLRKQEGALEGEARTISNKVAAEKEVLHTLQEEKAELKMMVERLDAELSIYEKKAALAESSQAELERVQLEMEGLQKELLRVDSLQKEIDLQNAKLDNMSAQRTKLEEDIALKNKELTALGEELGSKKTLAELAAHESKELKAQVEELLARASALEEEVTRKRTAIKTLETELLAVEENMARCLEDASADLKELEIERDNLQMELRTLSEQLQETQALADEQTAMAAEARQVRNPSPSVAFLCCTWRKQL
jgi:chromosome segregation ATPase